MPVPALLLAGSALASDADREPLLEARRAQLLQKREQQFRAADTDGDRGLSRDELRISTLPPVLLRRFDEIDADRDGKLGPEELQALEQRRLDSARRPAAEAGSGP